MGLRVFENAIIVVLAAGAAMSGGCSREQRESTGLRQMKETANQQAVFAAGCFWGVEEMFRNVPGVADTKVGFTGGTVVNPSYRQVCNTDTGHAEAVRVTFDPSVVSYQQLLEIFWSSHNPTTRNRQGPDVGSQYRSAIFFCDPDQQKLATSSRDTLQNSGKFSNEVVTEIAPTGEFYLAEEDHQRYFEKRGGGYCNTGVGAE